MTEDTHNQSNDTKIVGLSRKSWPDQEWVECMNKVAQNKDREAFRKLFDHFAPRLKSYAFSHQDFSNSELAEEIVQETMIKVWQKAELFHRDKAAVSTWIFTIARNCRIDLLRKQKNIDPMLDADELHIEDESDYSNPTRLTETSKSETTVKESLAALPADQSQIVSKVYLEGKTHQEVSTELELPLGTVKSRLRLAMEKLKHQMGAR